MKRGIDLEVLQAARYWQESRGGPWTLAQWRAFALEQGASESELDEARARAMLSREQWLWHWADSGFTSFRCAETYAAALMVTDPSQQGDLIIPWRAVRVDVPPGLLVNAACDVHSIYVCGESEGQSAMLAYSDRPIMVEAHTGDLELDGAIYRARVADTLADVLWHRNDEELSWLRGEPALEDDKERLMLLCCNYVSGLFYTLQHTRDWSETQHKNRWAAAHLRKGPRPPPTHRNVVCGRPIKVDLRPMVHAQARGETRRSAPGMFQSCVRGHYKRQVIGVGRSGRKVIWVEPYWRGPEGAPVLVRPYHFTGS